MASSINCASAARVIVTVASGLVTLGLLKVDACRPLREATQVAYLDAGWPDVLTRGSERVRLGRSL